jgi:membrane-associated protease RseP (regulator of RpoE activity)
MAMKPLIISSAAAALLLCAAAARGRSVLEGLEIVEGDKGGVEVLAVAPGTPAAESGLHAGDRITAIGGAEVKGLDDYVRLSKGLKGGAGGARIDFIREGAPQSADLSIHSIPLREKWGIAVATWRSAKAGGEGAEYWLEQARTQMRRNERRGEGALGPEDYGKAILSLFTALEANPDSLGAAVLAARQYGRLSGLYARKGDRKKAVWCLRRALMLYGNSIQKAGGMQELALVKDGLQEMRKSLAGME